MKRSTARWTTSLAAAALLGLPVASTAQTSPTTRPPATSTQQPTTGSQSATAPQNAEAQDHLRQAKAALDNVAPTAVAGSNKTQLAELKRHLNALERTAGSNSNASATGAANRSARATTARGAASWSTEVAAIDKILTAMLGTSATGSATDPAPPTGTAGTSGRTAAANLDEATRTQLVEVRTHVTAFAAAMSGTSTSSDAAAPSSTTGSSSATGTAGSTSMTGSTGATTGSATAQDPAQTSAPSSKADPDTARRSLTDARDTLSQLTQLPAAAQLSGEARTQVSQLISNFNELITTQSEWHGSYAKLEANLNALIGPDNTDAEATGGVSTGTTGTTGTTGATGTAGTAGTTGTTAGVANLDPAIRAKLVELRQKLNAFEKAAGGNATPSGAATTGTAGSMTTGATGSTGTAATGSTGSTASTDTQSATSSSASSQGAEQMGHDEALRHIAAIEAILNANGSGSPASTAAASTTGSTGSTSGTAGTTGSTTGTTGSASPSTGARLTLTSAQLEQLRTHLTELRRLVGEAKK